MQEWSNILVWAKVTGDQWKTVAAALGDETLTDFNTILALTRDDIRDAVRDAKSSPIIKGRLNLALNVARLRVELPILDYFADPPAGVGPQAPAAAAVVQVAGDDAPESVAKHTLKVSQLFDQGLRMEVRPCTTEEIRTMRKRWIDIMKLPPARNRKPTDNQLSVLHRLQELGLNLLAFDMAIWGPFGDRRERHFSLTVHHLTANGEYIPKLISGAQSLEDWLDAWEFATVPFVMGRVVEHGVADAYKAHIREMASGYPEAWWVFALGDWEYRYEVAPEEMERQREFHSSSPQFSSFNPDMPWNSVLMAAVKGVEAIQYWDKVREKARRWLDHRREPTQSGWGKHQEDLYAPMRPPSAAGRAAAGPGLGEQASGSDRKRRRQDWFENTVAKSARQTPQQGQPPPPPPAQGSRIGDKVSWRRSDGRFFTDEEGVDLCYAWGRAADGCADVCRSNPPRSHACEWCRERHRSVKCPTHPNWVPLPQKGSGKGKGKK